MSTLVKNHVGQDRLATAYKRTQPRNLSVVSSISSTTSSRTENNNYSTQRNITQLNHNSTSEEERPFTRNNKFTNKETRTTIQNDKITSMALNVAQKLRLHGRLIRRRYQPTQHFRYFGNTSQASRIFNDGSVRNAKLFVLKQRAVDEAWEGVEKPMGVRILNQTERLSVVETVWIKRN